MTSVKSSNRTVRSARWSTKFQMHLRKNLTLHKGRKQRLQREKENKGVVRLESET